MKTHPHNLMLTELPLRYYWRLGLQHMMGGHNLACNTLLWATEEASPGIRIHLAGVYGAPTRLSTKFRGPVNIWSRPREFTGGREGRH